MKKLVYILCASLICLSGSSMYVSAEGNATVGSAFAVNDDAVYEKSASTVETEKELETAPTNTADETTKKIISDKLKSDIEAGLEKIEVRMYCTYKVDTKAIKIESEKATEEYKNTLDISKYSYDELNEMLGEFKANYSGNLFEEASIQKQKELCDFIGIDFSDVTFFGTVLTCTLTPEQIYKVAGTSYVKGKIMENSEFISGEDLGYTEELLEATTDAEKITDKRDPDSKLSDGVKKAISEGKENISVYLIFKYSAEEIGNEAQKRAEKEISELDESEYNEKVIYAIESKYLREVENEYINSILNEIGTDISKTKNKGWLTCTLDPEQINAAESNEKILGIFLDDVNYYLPVDDPLLYEEPSEFAKGDANLDGNVNIANAVLVMQVATNPDKYAQGKSEFSITAQGEINADVDGKAGLTNADALLIQKFKLGLINKF